MDSETTVIGVGNLLLEDEGVGIHTARELRKRKLPDKVEILDWGTAPLDGLPRLDKISKIIIIDACKFNNPPGTVHKFSRGEIESISKNRKSFVSLHDSSFLEYVGPLMSVYPNIREITIIGIEISSMSWRTELSPELREKLPFITDEIIKEITN